MEESTITYRQATREELDLAAHWAAGEGWNPGLNDAATFWETDPTGFVCAERAGEVIATGSIVRYEDAFGFMGFFIVRPDLRGQGIGREFWHWRCDTLRQRLAPEAAIGMDGVFTMKPFYAKGGFTFSHRNLRMAGTGQVCSTDYGLIPLTELPFETVTAYDQKHFGFARPAFLKSWISPQGGCALGALANGQLQGIGVIRPCQQGFKIGPFFANTPAIADQIYRTLSHHARDQAVFLDIPENNPEAVALAHTHGLQEVFGCARMYHGPAPDLPWKNIFGITTFELG